MADRRTRFSKGLTGVTLYGTTVIDSSGSFTAGTITKTSAQLAAVPYGVASGDTSYDGYKIAAGHANVTGSRDICTGLTRVISGSANVANVLKKEAEAGSSGPWNAYCRINKIAGPQCPGVLDGWMKVIVRRLTASVESTTAASVDWFAIGV